MFRARQAAFRIRLLVTTCYGVSIVAEQEHVRKSWTSRVKHPMLRLIKMYRLPQHTCTACTVRYGTLRHGTARNGTAWQSGSIRAKANVRVLLSFQQPTFPMTSLVICNNMSPHFLNYIVSNPRRAPSGHAQRVPPAWGVTGLPHRWNRNPRPQPKQISRLVFLI